MALVDLPDIQFTEQDEQTIMNDIKLFYEGITGISLGRADPAMTVLNTLGKYIILQNVLIDRVAKAELLPFANGPILDYLGYFTKTERLPAAYATTTLRFSLSTALVTSQIIPAGTRVSPDNSEGELYFATVRDVTLSPGQLQIDVAARCLEAGEVGNGFVVGDINTLIDPVPYVQTVTNTSVSGGGADVEDDDSYRERIRLSNDSFTTAGPRDAYIYWAKTASSAILDVQATSPADMEVLVTILLDGGELPTPEIIEAVTSVLNVRKIRPLTDKVTASGPDLVEYDLNMTYYIHEDDVAMEESIKAEIQQAVSDYVIWQRSKLGRDINPSELIRRVMIAGAHRLDQSSLLPLYTPVPGTSVAREVTITLNYGGLSE
ncbi:baseplate J/gp47 family protein [Paenibacillus xylanexedens]|uniref:baseplate assembly protein n=1 Tax=Paenibacillus xylanexedens TaxID=528191 RepID=UPI001F468E1F|nr:baseplate J/gp47 family protein [Paenibacillus xylanexedens]MCF7753381.1 baseplate J/gp47 family protein [Paenibacillus xylanexedens]